VVAKALERPYLLMERYLGLSQRFQNEVARNVEDYLASGDALRLSSASQAIDGLQNELGELPPALAETCAPACRPWTNSAKPTCSPPANWRETRKPCCCKPNGNSAPALTNSASTPVATRLT
jgi:hypothetical protein